MNRAATNFMLFSAFIAFAFSSNADFAEDGSATDPTARDNWISVSCLDGRFNAKVPEKPKVEEQKVEVKQGVIITHSEKVITRGIVFNVLVSTFPAEVIASYESPMAGVERFAVAMMNQKSGAQRDYLKQIEGSKYVTIEHRFHFKKGKNPQGDEIAWYSIHRHALVGNSICTLFVDVQEVAQKLNAKKIDADLAKFFDSFEIKND